MTRADLPGGVGADGADGTLAAERPARSAAAPTSGALGGQICGVGTDLCDQRRIAAALERHGERFAQRILCPGELRTWQARRQRCAARGVAFVATRFAAKEALSKALGLGLRSPMSWRAAEVVHLPTGQPAWRWHGALAGWMAARGWLAHLSLSDDGDWASAFCVVERAAGLPGAASAADAHSPYNPTR